MTIQDQTRVTKQGIRDLNFYGSRKKLAAEATATGPLIGAELVAPVTTELTGETAAAATLALEPASSST
jgi:hypothetical protein